MFEHALRSKIKISNKKSEYEALPTKYKALLVEELDDLW